MKKTLIVYFSATGTTKVAAQKLAKEHNADLYEIVPEQAYTDADLDWRDKTSRSTIEMKDKSSRPAIKGRCENIAQYDTVWIGFPVWWYTAPTIVNTFIEAHDLSGKTLNVFATSGGSGVEVGHALLVPHLSNFLRFSLLYLNVITCRCVYIDC